MARQAARPRPQSSRSCPTFILRDMDPSTGEIYEMEFHPEAARMLSKPACWKALVEAVERWEAESG